MEFMKTEGDRAGVEIPDHAHKAANVIYAMIKQLEGKETYTFLDIDAALDALNRARLHMHMEE
jgi:hypothetical protein